MIFSVDNSLYSPEAINATVYRFSGNHIVSVGSTCNSNEYTITIEKRGTGELDPDIRNLFIKELTDQQVRLDIEARFGHIRDLIVEEAFKPISKG